MPTLVTIPFSHYCEKARWALRHVGVDFVEEGHLPFASRLATWRHGKWSSVPLLDTASRAGVVADSTAILHWADGQAASAERALYPADPTWRKDVEDLEDRFDKVLGVHTRRLAYSYVLPDKQLILEMATGVVPGVERMALGGLFPLIRRVMERGLEIDDASVARSGDKVDAEFAFVADRMADGRRYLVGDRFTAADLTFAALAAPVIGPAQYGARSPPVDRLPAAGQAHMQRLRAAPAGKFALRIYEEHRG